MVIKYIIGAIAICMSFSATVAHAVPSYDYNTGGEIIGISSVDVQGTLWDMTLHDGSFDSLYAALGSTAVYDRQFSHDASAALFAFTVTQAHPSELFLGCTSDAVGCFIVTAYLYEPDRSTVTGWMDGYSTVEDDILREGPMSSDMNFDIATWATWEVSSSTVPEPSIAILIASGLFAFGIVRRKSRA